MITGTAEAKLTLEQTLGPSGLQGWAPLALARLLNQVQVSGCGEVVSLCIRRHLQARVWAWRAGGGDVAVARGHGCLLVKVLARILPAHLLPLPLCSLRGAPSHACMEPLALGGGGGKAGVQGCASSGAAAGGWMGRSNQLSFRAPDPFSRFTFSIHKGLKTMDFHFACCTCNLPERPLGAACQPAAAREVM